MSLRIYPITSIIFGALRCIKSSELTSCSLINPWQPRRNRSMFSLIAKSPKLPSNERDYRRFSFALLTVLTSILSSSTILSKAIPAIPSYILWKNSSPFGFMGTISFTSGLSFNNLLIVLAYTLTSYFLKFPFIVLTFWLLADIPDKVRGNEESLSSPGCYSPILG